VIIQSMSLMRSTFRAFFALFLRLIYLNYQGLGDNMLFLTPGVLGPSQHKYLFECVCDSLLLLSLASVWTRIYSRSSSSHSGKKRANLTKGGIVSITGFSHPRAGLNLAYASGTVGARMVAILDSVVITSFKFLRPLCLMSVCSA
jgi:hypothetical protein